MSRSFYSENEENTFETLNDYEYLFKNFKSKSITLENALKELFLNAGATKVEANEIYENLYLICKERINKKWEEIHRQHKSISKEDALIISSYTYEAKPMYKNYSPYRILNTNLVSNNRKNGVSNIDKYLFIFLRALRKLNRCKRNFLFRCITSKVKLEKDPNNSKYIPYQVGNQKIFWAFTSTSDDENIAKNFLDDGKGTKYKIVGDNLWGYDITLFNVFDEKEILLEPERKYKIESVIKGECMEVCCKIIDDSTILHVCNDSNGKLRVNRYFNLILLVSCKNLKYISRNV